MRIYSLHTIFLSLPLIVAAVLLAALAGGGCSNAPSNYASVFALADSLAECGQPDSALRILSAVPPESLKGSDRALHALLTVKATDKAFITHTSDSAIGIALSRFGSHGPKLRRAETAYYHGRVLSDLSDYAGALGAYDDALAIIGPDTTRRALHLRSKVLSQNAQLLEDLRLYSEAIPYFNSAIESSIIIGDSLNAVLDLKEAAFCLVHIDSLMIAEKIIERALNYSPILPESIKAEIEIYRRYIFLHQGNASKAVDGIDSVISKIPVQFRNFSLMVAAKGYNAIGQKDSTNYYALQLLNHPSSENKSIAYRLLALNAIEAGQNDFAYSMLGKYKQETANIIKGSTDSPKTLTATISRAQRSEEQVMILKKRNIVLTISFVAILLFFLILEYIRARIRLRILSDLADFMQLQQQLDSPFISKKPAEIINRSQLLLPASTKSYSRISNSDLRNDLIERIKKLNETPSHVEPEISSSELCIKLRKLVKSNTCLPESSPIWEEIRQTILSVSPQFCNNLFLLVGKYNDMQFKIAMLIRIGFKPRDIAVLLARGANDLTYHRKQICKKAFGSAISLSDLSNAILKL